MIPDRLPTRASKGEERVFSLLKKLPDSYIVYYEPIVENRYPDFIVIAPDLGIMVIEVKGWYSRDIISADNNLVCVREGNEVIRRAHPVRQARDYMFSLMDRCKNVHRSHLLIQSNGKHKGKFKFPFGHIAVLSNITSKQLHEMELGNIFTDSKVVCRDLLASWLEMIEPERKLNEILKTYFDPCWQIDTMGSEMIEMLRAVIHPEIIISQKSLFEDSNWSNTANATQATNGQKDEELKVLDLRQELNARQIGDGHRLLYGVAGSGKTVLLLARARMLAEQRPDAKILVVCFNVSLASSLKNTLHDCSNIYINHFDGFSKANGVTRRRRPKEGNESLGSRLLSTLDSTQAVYSRYFDAIFVDEAQDFEPNWFPCLLASMKDPLDGDLLIVGDGNQGIYDSKKITWKSLGVNIQGRVLNTKLGLDKNYRNSREIIECAQIFSTSSERLTEDDRDLPDSMVSLKVDLEKCIRRTNIKPCLHISENLVEEQAAVMSCLKGLLDGNWFGTSIDPVSAHDIGVLYPYLPPTHKKTMRSIVCALNESLAPALWLNDPHNRRREDVDYDGIRIQTIHSSKGLQFKAVVLIFSDLLPRDWGEIDIEQDRRLFYVGLTRPEDYLLITASRKAEPLSVLQKSKVVKTI